MRLTALTFGVLLSVHAVVAGTAPVLGWQLNTLMTGIGFAAVPVLVLVTARAYAGWKDSQMKTLKYLTYSFGLLTVGITLHALHNMLMLPMTKALVHVPTAWHYYLTGSAEIFIFLSAIMFLQSMRSPT